MELQNYFEYKGIEQGSLTSYGVKLIFCHVVVTKKILKYHQVNYVRYPMYSSPVTKKTTISKSISLDNRTLENLQQNSDKVVSENAEAIISDLPNNYHPSWYQVILENKRYNHQIEPILNSKEIIVKEYGDWLKKCDYKSDENKKMINKLSDEINNLKNSINMNCKNINKCLFKKKSCIPYVLSFGLYNLFSPEKKIDDLMILNYSLKEKISFDESKIEYWKSCQRVNLNNIKSLKAELLTKTKPFDDKLKEAEINHEDNLNLIKPLGAR